MLKFRKHSIYLFLVFSVAVNAQSFSEKDLSTLRSLDIAIQNQNFSDQNIQNTLNTILRIERKRRANKTIAIVATSLSISGLLVGGIISAQKKDIVDGKFIYSENIGDFMMKASGVWGGISIPFWWLTYQRKKQRDELIKLF